MRQTPQIGHRQVRNFADRRIRIGPRLEVNLDETHPSERAGLDVIDIASQSEEALEGIGDVGFDLLRRHAAVERRHHDHGNLDLREQVHGHAEHCGHADHNDAEAQHQDEERILDRKPRHA